MKRREFLAAGCACGTLLAGAAAGAEWQMPARLARPELATEEGGLWAMMDRAEVQLRRSPFTLRDPKLHDYVQDIACRLGAAHCPDIRVYLVQTPLFNANMAPNGMMQVWTGLMLRVDNEAQLAAVIGHEIGHYLARHTLEHLRDVKSRSAFGQFLGLFGAAGAVGQLALLASAFAYSRDQEREADQIGVVLMRGAGYDPAEAGKVWDNLLLEIQAKPGGDPSRNPMFATHPSEEERRETLLRVAATAPGGVNNEDAWQQQTAPFRQQWLKDEVKRGQHEESLALLTRLIVHSPTRPEYFYARGEVYRSRAGDKDLDSALADYQSAIGLGGEPPETHRGLGLIQRQRMHAAEAKESFRRYLDAMPDAPDGPLIKSYLELLAQ